MVTPGRAFIACLIVVLVWSAAALAQSPVVVAVPARAGPVVGTTENSDAFIWRLFPVYRACLEQRPIAGGVRNLGVVQTTPSRPSRIGLSRESR